VLELDLVGGKVPPRGKQLRLELRLDHLQGLRRGIVLGHGAGRRHEHALGARDGPVEPGPKVGKERLNVGDRGAPGAEPAVDRGAHPRDAVKADHRVEQRLEPRRPGMDPRDHPVQVRDAHERAPVGHKKKN
jgi:hypothetical protein